MIEPLTEVEVERFRERVEKLDEAGQLLRALQCSLSHGDRELAATLVRLVDQRVAEVRDDLDAFAGVCANDLAVTVA